MKMDRSKRTARAATQRTKTENAAGGAGSKAYRKAKAATALEIAHLATTRGLEDRAQQVGTSAEVKDSAIRADSVEQPLPMGPSFTVVRTDLIRKIVRAARKSGIVALCAPQGFGKTALLLQYVNEVRRDPGRGTAQMIDAHGALLEELLVQLDAVEQRCDQAVRPALAIDNLPAFEGQQAEECVRRLRAMRDRSFELVIACTPAARTMVHTLGDSVKINARELMVRPREYAEWSRVFSISNHLDVYGLTQGIPMLIAALQATVDGDGAAPSQLDVYIGKLYWAVLHELWRTDRDLFTVAALFVLVESGQIRDFEQAGTKIAPRTLQRLAHDYPLFGYDAASGRFACMGSDGDALLRVRSYIAKKAEALVHRAVKVQLKAGRTDQAVEMVDELLTEADAVQIAERAPMQLVLAGQAPFINRIVHELERQELACVHPALKLAVYGAALTIGDMRMARTMVGELVLAGSAGVKGINPDDWNAAREFGRMWSDCRGVVLPPAPDMALDNARSVVADALRLHRECVTKLVRTGEWTGVAERFLEKHQGPALGEARICLPRLLLTCDVMLAEALTGSFGHLDERDRTLGSLQHVLRERRLEPILCYVRLVCSIRRMLAGNAIVDEQAIVDANTMAVRTSDLDLQLLSIIFEGWQDLVTGQAASAHFRGQQALKLAGTAQPYLARAALFLERVANMRNSSYFAICEEAGSLDLAKERVCPEEAWWCALYLSAAREEAELGAWFSLHKDTILDPAFRLFARLAMSLMGERADPVRRLLPRDVLPYYLMEGEEAPAAEPLFRVLRSPAEEEEGVGHIVFRLFGGFTIERNGHVLTSTVWKRKKAVLLAARLVLAQGGLVNRQTIWDEFWPGMDYARARENLYSTISVLRRALKQHGKDGPQYIVLHGDSIGINPEYVTSDVNAFEELSRKILLGHLHLSAPKLIELCLRAEQLYAGPLFVPEKVSIDFFARTRRVMQSKFVDCMIRGINVALDEQDENAALWMAESGLQQDAHREDLLRSAMRVYDFLGRRKDVVELYGKHLQNLEMRDKGEPEPETVKLYQDIMRRYRIQNMM